MKYKRYIYQYTKIVTLQQQHPSVWRGNYLWDLLVSNIMLMIGRIIGSKSILEILASLKIYLALNTAGVELIQCH